MKSVRLFDNCLFDGDTYQVIAQDGAILALRSYTTSRVRHVGITELLGDDSYEPDVKVALPVLDDVAILETLPSVLRQKTIDLYQHIYEIEHGIMPPESESWGESRPEYSLSRSLGDRIRAKCQELAAAGVPRSERSLNRDLAAYRKSGVAGLVDKRTRRESALGRSQDEQLIELIEAELSDQTMRSTGTRTRVITKVEFRAEQIGVAVPSRATMFRLLKELERKRHSFGNATVRRTQANRPDRAFGRRAPLRPGEIVEIDSTKLDLLVIFPDGSTGRPELTTMIDVATLTVAGSVLLPEATKGSDLAALVLARSLTPLPMQPGWSEELSLSRSILPADMIEPNEKLQALVAARPLIYPESITVDRGSNYVGSVFRAACEKLQISITLSAPGTPTDKPHIERQFHDVHRGLIQYLDGYVGPNVVRRGVNPAAEARWTVSQVQSLLDQWLLAHWQVKPRKNLALPAMPKRSLSPNEMYAALSGIAPTPAVALSRDDYIALMPVAYRTIQHYGINFNTLHYDSPELNPYRNTSSGLPSPANGKWEIRFDPARMNTIFVRDHRGQRWIEAPWSLAKQTLAPFSDSVLSAAIKAVKRRDDTTPAVDVLKEINRIQSFPPNLTGLERKASRRHPQLTVPAPLEHEEIPIEEVGLFDEQTPDLRPRGKRSRKLL